MYKWSVAPLCEKQLRDVRKSDILNNGLYRKCNTYHSGGGYDQLPGILENRGMFTSDKQFVVQLAGCPFRCPYCYVTPDGITGKSVAISTEKLVKDFKASGQDIFHLMGGAPALYLDHWGELIQLLEKEGCKVFHSDLLLVECEYTDKIMQSIKSDIGIHAVSIKGFDRDSYKLNTGKKIDIELMRHNIKQLRHNGINHYITFTGLGKSETRDAIKWLEITPDQLEDSFIIALKHYKALE